ncbi:MAG: glycine cleavage system aminomethyltransferase GcvT [Streptomycetaceae bacterium]|nr:MAG: glycine cleavage system aminomethyltransferase GcvT [Streptomycetaceae bacterium]
MKTSPLNDKHLARNAKMADFGGWLMPIEYPGGGVLAEHTAVRERVGIFDVSHLGKASVVGAGALDFLNTMFTNDLNRIEDGSAQYTLLCTPEGGVIDDLIAYRNSVDNIFLVPNASNTSDVVAVLQSHTPANIVVTNLHNEFAVLAVQGPSAPQVMQSLGINTDIDYMAFSHVVIAGAEVILCRTGYTGELGYELLPKVADASRVWDALVAAMEPLGGLVCGLGARDTLRTEMGYPLHGHELSLDITPVQASATWAIGWDKPGFIGSDVLRAEKANKPARRSVAIKSLDRGIPRGHMEVKNAAGEVLGEVTSGTFSPTLKVGIGLALLNSSVKVGDQLTIDVRGRDSLCEVVKLPFVPSHVR